MMYNTQMEQLGRERSAIREIFEIGRRRKAEIGAEKVFDFSLGNPSAPTPPCIGEEIVRLVRSMSAEDLHGYTSAAGMSEARAAVAAHLSRTQAPMSGELVYMTCGAAASLSIALKAVLQEGDEVITVSPFFPEYAVFAAAAGGKLVPVPAAENFHPDLGALERAITSRTRVLLLNTPNNPTGAAYTQEELDAIGALLRRKGGNILLFSDEPYRELCYGGSPASALKAYENTAVLYSYSKSLSLAGERIGYIAVSPRAKDAEGLFHAMLGAGRSLGYVCAPALFQRLVAKFAGLTGDFSVYRRNRDVLVSALSSYGYAFSAPEGAFYLFMKAPAPSAADFCARAREKEILLVPSDSFGAEGYVRLAYCVPPDVVDRSLPAFRALARESGL